MLSKNKTFIALSVKFLLCITTLRAQVKADSVKQNIPIFLPSVNQAIIAKQPAFKSSFPANLYTKNLPFFCNKELQVQKAVGIPIKFRLGTVEDCDKLEGKR